MDQVGACLAPGSTGDIAHGVLFRMRGGPARGGEARGDGLNGVGLVVEWNFCGSGGA